MEKSINIEFEVVNMLESLVLTNLKKHSFDVILDAALFHLFSNEDRQIYVKNLEYLIKPGGLYILLCFSEKEIRKNKPRHVKKCDLDQLFSSKNGWTIDSTEDVIYEARTDCPRPPTAQAYLSFILRN
jgi:cyclopropane fatty-acyl-phospholipid synthase-like methyltransferase